MKYILRKDVLGSVPEIKITEADYAAYKGARDVLSNAFAIEEKYEILISNYLDFEKQIFDATADFMVRDYLDYSADFFRVRLGFNIRLLNVLSSTRVYVDQLEQHVRECLPERTADQTKAFVNAFFATEFDKYHEYRFMDKLRNYVQHRGLPVHWASSGSGWTTLGADGLLEYSVELAPDRSRLLEDDAFKKTVLAELPEKLDLKAATRRYIESLSTVQTAARTLIRESVERSRQILEEAHSRYKEVYKDCIGLSASEWDGEQRLEIFPLLLDWDDIRQNLQKRNRNLTNLTKRYVSSRVKNDQR